MDGRSFRAAVLSGFGYRNGTVSAERATRQMQFLLVWELTEAAQ